jgi:hypothetical protein
MKVCVINGEYTDCHKSQYFPNSLRGRYETVHPTTTWAKVQCDFIIRFSEIRSEGQAIVALQYAKQKKYESMETIIISSSNYV